MHVRCQIRHTELRISKSVAGRADIDVSVSGGHVMPPCLHPLSDRRRHREREREREREGEGERERERERERESGVRGGGGGRFVP